MNLNFKIEYKKKILIQILNHFPILAAAYFSPLNTFFRVQLAVQPHAHKPNEFGIYYVNHTPRPVRTSLCPTLHHIGILVFS
jgi:hypothetical protein